MPNKIAPLRNVAAKEIPVLSVSFGLIDQNQETSDQLTNKIRVYKTRPNIFGKGCLCQIFKPRQNMTALANNGARPLDKKIPMGMNKIAVKPRICPQLIKGF